MSFRIVRGVGGLAGGRLTDWSRYEWVPNPDNGSQPGIDHGNPSDIAVALTGVQATGAPKYSMYNERGIDPTVYGPNTFPDLASNWEGLPIGSPYDYAEIGALDSLRAAAPYRKTGKSYTVLAYDENGSGLQSVSLGFATVPPVGYTGTGYTQLGTYWLYDPVLGYLSTNSGTPTPTTKWTDVEFQDTLAGFGRKEFHLKVDHDAGTITLGIVTDWVLGTIHWSTAVSMTGLAGVDVIPVVIANQAATDLCYAYIYTNLQIQADPVIDYGSRLSWPNWVDLTGGYTWFLPSWLENSTREYRADLTGVSAYGHPRAPYWKADPANITLSANGRTAAFVSTGWDALGAVVNPPKSSGKWYYEIVLTDVTVTNPEVALGWTNFAPENGSFYNQFSNPVPSLCIFRSNGSYQGGNGGSMTLPYTWVGPLDFGSVIQFALDLDAGTFDLGMNNVWLVTGQGFTGFTGDIRPFVTSYGSPDSSTTANIRLVDTEQTYAAPAGYVAWGVYPPSMAASASLPPNTYAITGVQASAAVQSVATSRTNPLSTVLGTGGIGTVVKGMRLEGNQAAGSVGSVTGGQVFLRAITGVQASGDTGSTRDGQATALQVGAEFGADGSSTFLNEAHYIPPFALTITNVGSCTVTTSFSKRGTRSLKTPATANTGYVSFSIGTSLDIQWTSAPSLSIRLSYAWPVNPGAERVPLFWMGGNSGGLVNPVFMGGYLISPGTTGNLKLCLCGFFNGSWNNGSNTGTDLQWDVPRQAINTFTEVEFCVVAGTWYCFVDGVAYTCTGPNTSRAVQGRSDLTNNTVYVGATFTNVDGVIQQYPGLMIDDFCFKSSNVDPRFKAQTVAYTPAALSIPESGSITGAVWPVTYISGVQANTAPNDGCLGSEVLLLDCDGVSGASTFTDSSPYGHVPVNAGATNVTNNTSDPVAGMPVINYRRGASSLRFTDTRNSRLEVPNHAAMVLGVKDFVIQFEFQPQSQTLPNTILNHGEYSGTPGEFNFTVRIYKTGGQSNSSVEFRYPIAGPSTAIQTWVLSSYFGYNIYWGDYTLHAISIERKNNLLYLYWNGVQQGAGRDISAMVAAPSAPTLPLEIGTFNAINGRLDNLGIYIGSGSPLHSGDYVSGGLLTPPKTLSTSVLTAQVQQPITRPITTVVGTGAVNKLFIGREVQTGGMTGLVGNATPKTTVAITGVQGTGAVDKVGTGRNLTTVLATGSPGSLTLSPWLGTVLATGSVGDLTASITAGQGATIVGQASTGAVGTAGVLVTVPLSGVLATSAVDVLWTGRGITSTPGTGGVGSLGKTHDQSVTGVAGTTAVQSVAANLHSVPLTGNQGNTAVQSVGTRIDPFRAATTVLATGSAGSVVPSTALPLTTVAGTGAVQGTPFAMDRLLFGVQTGTAVGPLGYTTEFLIPISGVQATGYVQTLASGEGYSPAGVQAQGQVGSVASLVTVQLSGVQSISGVGGVVFSRPVTVALTGVSASSAITSLNPGVLIGVSGVQSVIALGMLAVERLKAVTGVSAQSFTSSPSTARLVPFPGVSGVGALGQLGFGREYPLSGVWTTTYVGDLVIVETGQYTYRIRLGGTTVNKSAAQAVSLFLPASSDHNTAILGATLVLSLSKAGGALVPIVRVVTEVGAGWYSVQLTANDTDTLGDLVLVASAPGADTAAVIAQVVLPAALEGPVRDQFNNLSALVAATS